MNIKVNYYNDFSIHKLNETCTIENYSFQYEMTQPATNVIFTLENGELVSLFRPEKTIISVEN